MTPREILRVAVSCLVLCAVTLAVFSGVVDNAFLGWDDRLYVVDNPFIATGMSLSNIHAVFTGYVAGNWHPVTMLSHMLDVELFGLDPAYHHGTNLLFHCCNTVLVYLFFLRTTKENRAAFLVALLFGIHPLHVESVAWVAERKDVVSSFFVLLALLLYTWYVAARTTQRKYCLYGTICLLHLLGLMSKPMVVTFPFLLLIVDYWPLDRSADHRISRLVMEKLPLFLSSALFVYVTMHAQPEYGTDFAGNFVVALYSSFNNVLRFIAPIHLSFLYDASYSLSLPIFMAAVASLCIVSHGVIALRQRYPFLVAGMMMYLIMYLPVSGIIRIGRHLYADRYLYLPLLGLIVIAVYGITLHCKRLVAIIPLCAIIWGIITFQYEKSWNSSYALYRNALVQNGQNYRANLEMGRLYYTFGNYRAALPYLHTAVTLPARAHTTATMSLGEAAVFHLNDFEQLRANPLYDKDLYEGYCMLAEIYTRQGDLHNAALATNKSASYLTKTKP